MTGGCTRTSVFVPEAIQLEPPPIMITANQLYQEYAADEAAADAKYKGKEVWVIEAMVDSYIESEGGNYIMMRWYQPPEYLVDPLVLERDHSLIVPPGYYLSTVNLEPQSSEGFKDIPPGYDIGIAAGFGVTHVVTGYVVEVVGERQGISEGVITVKINWIAKTGEVPPATTPIIVY